MRQVRRTIENVTLLEIKAYSIFILDKTDARYDDEKFINPIMRMPFVR